MTNFFFFILQFSSPSFFFVIVDAGAAGAIDFSENSENCARKKNTHKKKSAVLKYVFSRISRMKIFFFHKSIAQ